jgi:hypothetical protein
LRARRVAWGSVGQWIEHRQHDARFGSIVLQGNMIGVADANLVMKLLH